MNKFYAQLCLLDQPFVKDPKKTVGQILDNVNVVRFIRWELGE